MSPVKKPHNAPKVGTIYERKFKGKMFRMEVVLNNQRLAYRVGDRDFNSASAAAKSVTGTEVNGWKFWHLD